MKKQYAFPSYLSARLNSDGMLLRDYFAAKAVQGMLASEEYSSVPPAKLATWSYEQADAMLKARDEK